MWPSLHRAPTPWKPNPATKDGAYNDATPTALANANFMYFWGLAPDLNPVLSYVTTDLHTGQEIVVNVTQPGHKLFPGFTARLISEDNGVTTMKTFGEGMGWLQSDEDASQLQRDQINNV